LGWVKINSVWEELRISVVREELLKTEWQKNYLGKTDKLKLIQYNIHDDEEILQNTLLFYLLEDSYCQT